MATEVRPVQVSGGIEVSDDGTATVLRISGELDAASCPAIAPILLEAVDPGTPVVVDLADLAFCDSTGVALFIATQQRAVETGATLVIRNATPRVLRLFEITGLDTIFTTLGGNGAADDS